MGCIFSSRSYFFGLTLYLVFPFFPSSFFRTLTSPNPWFQNSKYYLPLSAYLPPNFPCTYLLTIFNPLPLSYPPIDLSTYLHNHPPTYLALTQYWHGKYCKKYKYCKNMSIFILLSFKPQMKMKFQLYMQILHFVKYL
jgi:hypothetical protein